MRFNLHPDVNVQIRFIFLDRRKLTKEELIDLYKNLLNDADILYDRQNELRRVLIISLVKGLKEQIFFASLIGNETFNSIIFPEIKDEDVEACKEETEAKFAKEELII